MKAIVAEIDKKQMIVITDKGDFIKVKRQMSAAIGDEIELKPQKINPAYRRVASLAACFLACIFLSTGVYAYYTPYSYVSVDINPSITLSLNRFERVIAVEPLTEDAAGLIEASENIKNKEIDEALSEIIKSASEEGYISKETENQVMVVVSAKNPGQEEKLAAAVNAAAAVELSKVNDNYGVTVEKTSVEDYKAALSNKVSPGKEILAGRLMEVNPEIKAEDARKMSVKEIMSHIKEGKKAAMATEKDDKDSVKNKDNKDNAKDKSKEEQVLGSKDKDKEGGNKAAKIDADDKNSNKGSEKNKPTVAASKDNSSKPAAASKDTEGRDEGNSKGNAGVSGKDDKDNKQTGSDKGKAGSSGREGKDDEDEDDEGDKDKEDSDDEGDKDDKYKEDDNDEDDDDDDDDDDDEDEDTKDKDKKEDKDDKGPGGNKDNDGKDKGKGKKGD
ncbi:MAG TPA: anti-sigma factor domain-containing protein [Clostridia bacterium]|nr:anti-sigma factor domain-containing protein [Clostridia bacterium]